MILNLVIFISVTGKASDFFNFINVGNTDPRLPNTFPYLTTLNFIFLEPDIFCAEVNNLSEHNFVAPYKFIGELALSVDKANTFLTFEFKTHSIML